MSDFTDVSKVDPEVLRKAEKLMEKDKYNLITNAEHTFVMNIMFSMRFAWTTKTWAGATDGVYIYTNPENYVKQDQPFRQFLLLHETYHVVFKHVCRGKAMPHLDQQKMNAAEDYMINLLIKDQLGWVPKEALCDEKYRGMSSMEIYHLLPVAPPSQMGGDVMQLGEGEPGEGDAAQGDTGMSNDELGDLIDQRVISAAIAHEKATDNKPGEGGEGSSLGRYINDMMNPRINWLPIARKHMTQYTGKGFSLTRPNRRFLPHHICMPSRCAKGMAEVAVYLDSSGSVTESELAEYLAFVRHLHTSVKPFQTHIASFDHNLHPSGVYSRSQRIPALSLEGGGGTDIENVMADCETIKPKLVVIFTDGYFNPPSPAAVPYDLVWIILDNPNFTCHIGRVIHHSTK